MNRSEHILAQLQTELGFSPQLLGGKKTVLAQIDRFLAHSDIPDELDVITQPRLWNRLISEVIVPETSFFRYPESFAMLREWVRARPRHPLHTLCIPCSTGEEAYSIAITFREAGALSFHIAAYDASARAIAQSRAGQYPARAMRGMPEALQKQWFRSHAGELSAEDSLRMPITFDVANIFALDAPASSFDFIFCRNLLIYLDTENQRRIFERLDQWLKPDGLLFLGPGEATTAASHGWKSTGHAMSFSFVRAVNPADGFKPRAIAPRKITPRPVTRPSPPAPQPRTPQPKAAAVTNWFSNAVEFADAGKLPEAMEALRMFHESRGATPESLLLQGILEEAQGRRNAAESSYRKALYLEPDHLDTLLHLSLLLESDGRAQSAIPFRRRIDRISAAS